MGRGNSFNHKLKGHEHKVPKYGKNLPPKRSEEAEFAIEPVASALDRPVSVKVEKK